MSSRGDHQTVPLSVLLRREQNSERIENPELSYGQANQSKKGEDFTLLKTECQRIVGDGITTFSVFGVIFFDFFSYVGLFLQFMNGNLIINKFLCMD